MELAVPEQAFNTLREKMVAPAKNLLTPQAVQVNFLD
jgi:hypothetical protein